MQGKGSATYYVAGEKFIKLNQENKTHQLDSKTHQLPLTEELRTEVNALGKSPRK